MFSKFFSITVFFLASVIFIGLSLFYSHIDLCQPYPLRISIISSQVLTDAQEKNDDNLIDMLIYSREDEEVKIEENRNK